MWPLSPSAALRQLKGDRPGSHPHLHHLSGRRAGASDPLPPEGGLIGRDARVCTIWVHEDDAGVSRRHAQVWGAPGAWWIRDLGTPNGTTVDGRPIAEPTPLHHGAVIGLGPHITLRFDAPQLPVDPVPPPPPPPIDPVALVPRLLVVAALLGLIGGVGFWALSEVKADRLARAERREAARAELWQRFLAGEDLAGLGALVEVATAPIDLPSAPAPVEPDPLSAHIRDALTALIGQPPGRPVDPFFRDAVEDQIAGIFLNPRCACRLRALRPELTALLRGELRAVGGVESRADMLVYVAWIESCYNPNACSPAAARGMWQFIPRTANKYGLRADEAVDERCDWRKATTTAARYFTATFKACGDQYPLLAIAAYNTGEQRACAIAHNEQLPESRRDVLGFIASGLLLPETVAYVPRMIAASFVGEHPEEALSVARERHPNIQADTTCKESWIQVPESLSCPDGASACPLKTGISGVESSKNPL